MFKLRFLIPVSLLGIAGAAFAAEDHGPGRQMLEELDTNGDGQISITEFQGRDNNALTMMDSDANGVLTIDEFLNARPGPGAGMRPERGDRAGDGRQPSAEQMAKMQEMRAARATARFQEMDTDGDEIVTLAEFQIATFAELDRDDDGFLKGDELRPPRMGRPGPEGNRGDREPRGPRGPHAENKPGN